MKTPSLWLSGLFALLQIAHGIPLSARDSESADCPPGIIPTPSYGTKGGVFSVCSVIDINAPQENIYSILKNFDGYPNWNTFVQYVTKTSSGPYQLNSTMTFHNAMIFPLIDYPSDERISVWNEEVTNAEGYDELHVAWALNTNATALLNAEHLTIVRDLKNGTNRVVSFETYYGDIAPVVEVVTVVQLNHDFKAQNEDLKAWAEAGHTS